jgi:hypothetical protein
MNFFCPKIGNNSELETYENLKKFVEDWLGKKSTSRKIHTIDYEHNGKTYHAEVDGIALVNAERIYAIFEFDDGSFCVCTENRGVKKGYPLLVGKIDCISVRDFDN